MYNEEPVIGMALIDVMGWLCVARGEAQGSKTLQPVIFMRQS
jgi:hypothetical protein